MKKRHLNLFLLALLVLIGIDYKPFPVEYDSRVVQIPDMPFDQMTRENYEAYLRTHPFQNKEPLSKEELKKIPKKDRPDLAAEQNYLATLDPALGFPPSERLQTCWDEIRTTNQFYEMLPGAPTSPWSERGPNNVGGRTRALMFDPNDPSYNKVWAAGVAGGIWFNNNISDPNQSWTKINDFQSNLAVSALAYDPTAPMTFYAGTGEGFYNADGVRGAGIWKTTDGGTSWNQMSSTAVSGFEYVQKIVVTGSGTILAATRSASNFSSSGLYRSTDDGASWTQLFSGPFADIEIASNGDIYASEGLIFDAGILRKSTDDGVNWTVLNTATNGQRIEIATAPSAPNTVYAVATDDVSLVDVGWFQKSTDGGSTWTDITIPRYTEQNCVEGTRDFTRGQAWYDLILAVHPSNPDIVIAGGIDLHRSTDGGSTWELISYWTGACDEFVHADQHSILFKPNNENAAIIGNDGGVFYTTDMGNSSDPSFAARNKDYNVTQFYSAAIHPTPALDYYLGGTQDNGSHQFTAAGINSTREVTGGDGGFTHINQANPQIQFTSFTGLTFNRSTDGGNTWNFIGGFQGGLFINPSDYDDDQDVLFASFSETHVFRALNFSDPNYTAQIIPVPLGAPVTHVRVSPHTQGSSTVFVGTGAGRVFKLENADGDFPTFLEIPAPTFPNGTISCIDLGADENEILVTFSNYGVTSVWYTNDGGTTWEAKEGNLPDFPVRWAMFNPLNRNEVILATEMGVWGTSDISIASPSWTPSNLGLANVRVDMFQTRPSDNQVIAATHGRGMYTSTFMENVSCEITGIAVDNISACNDNGTADPADDFFTSDVTVNFSIPPASGTLDLSGSGSGSVPVDSLGNTGSYTFLGVVMPADGNTLSLTASFSDDTDCSFTESDAGTAPASCSMQPCMITGIELEFGSCNDNGTPDPSDDFYLANVGVTFNNPPTTGTLELFGDGTASVSVANLDNAVSHLFSDVIMPADGGDISLAAIFTADTTCSFGDDFLGTAPGPCSVEPPSCEIKGITVFNESDCNDNGTADPSDDFFTADVFVYYENPPSTGLLNLFGDAQAVDSTFAQDTAVVFSGLTFPADGGAIALGASFSADSSCSLFEPNAGTAPGPCSVGPPSCEIKGITVFNESACDDNGTADPSDDFFTADVFVYYENPPATGFLNLFGDAQAMDSTFAQDTAVVFSGLTFPADGGAIALGASFSADTSCSLFEPNAGTAPGPCSVEPPSCEIKGITVFNESACDDNGTADPSDDFFTADVFVYYENPPATGFLNLFGDAQAMDSTFAQDTAVVFSGLTFPADGGAIALGASFSADTSCSLFEPNAGTAPGPCSVEPPSCEIKGITVFNESACDDNGTADPSDDFFTADVFVYYENPPATGFLNLFGDAQAMDSTFAQDTAVVFSGLTFPADGGAIALGASFSADSSCSLFEPNAGMAPTSCSDSGCEVQNLALGKPAKTPCDYGFSYAGLGVDGIPGGNTPWTNNPDLVHICQEHVNDWWEVDLGDGEKGETFEISEICIYNRVSTNKYIVNRLSNFYLFISCEPFSEKASIEDLLSDKSVYSLFIEDAPGYPSCYKIPEVIGQYVRIQKPGEAPLHFGEVEVYGCPSEESCGPKDDPCFALEDPKIEPAGPFLSTDSPQQLVATPSGGVWLGPVSSSGIFDPSMGPGVYSIAYKVEDKDCEKMDMVEILVQDPSECNTPTNLAYGKPAMQSSTYANGVASIAVDGDLDGSRGPWTNPSIQHTEKEQSPWWKVDLAEKANIKEIEIYNRTDCCSGRLRDFYVFASAKPIDATRSMGSLKSDSDISYVHYPGVAGSFESIKLETEARYVAIKLSGEGPLNMAEVKVMGCQTNPPKDCDFVTPGIAVTPPSDCKSSDGEIYVTGVSGRKFEFSLDPAGPYQYPTGITFKDLKAGTYTLYVRDREQPGCVNQIPVEVIPDGGCGMVCSAPENLTAGAKASQSSTYGKGSAEYAIDKNLIGDSPWTANLQHTKKEASPWWKLELKGMAMVEEVKIYNRSNCCMDRLRDFYVFASEYPIDGNLSIGKLTSHPDIAHQYFPGKAGKTASFYFEGIKAKYILVKLANHGELHMSEVEVIGCTTGSTSNRFADANSAVDTDEAIKLATYPNPFTGSFTLEIKGELGSSGNLYLVNALGQILEKHIVEGNSTLVLGEGLAKGMYFVQVVDGEKVHQVKVVKLK